MVGIVARTKERAQFIRETLGFDPKGAVLIAIGNADVVRGCKLDVVIWDDVNLPESMTDAIEPALVECKLALEVVGSW